MILEDTQVLAQVDLHPQSPLTECIPLLDLQAQNKEHSPVFSRNKTNKPWISISLQVNYEYIFQHFQTLVNVSIFDL
jgi:hypothetical protein